MTATRLTDLHPVAEHTCANDIQFIKFLDDNSIQVQEGNNLYPIQPLNTQNSAHASTSTNFHVLTTVANTVYIKENEKIKHCLTHNAPIKLASLSPDNTHIAVCTEPAQKIRIYKLPEVSQLAPIQLEPTRPRIEIQKPWYRTWINALSKHKWNIVSSVAKIAAGACLYACYNKYESKIWNILHRFGGKENV